MESVTISEPESPPCPMTVEGDRTDTSVWPVKYTEPEP